jgi:hypothetical protein
MQGKCSTLLVIAFLAIPLSLTSLSSNRHEIISPRDGQAVLEEHLASLYSYLGGAENLPCYEAFSRAVTGYFNLERAGKIKNELLTIIDFSVSANSERLWVINIPNMAIVHTSLVAHGRNSGEEFARYFSNILHSNKSSLGFFITGHTYYGQHGKSLFLKGMEHGINDNAGHRGIVIHSADYVSNEYIRYYGRLGRSLGCPSIPIEDHQRIIRMLSGRSCLYIHYPDKDYLNTSTLFETDITLKQIGPLVEELHRAYLERTEFFRSFNWDEPGEGWRSALNSNWSLS